MSTLANIMSLFFALGLTHVLVRWVKRSRLPLPPGPKGLPFIGNLHQMRFGGFDWEQYREWAKEFDTDVLFIDVAGTPIVVLNSAEVATDLLEHRSSIYSGRRAEPLHTTRFPDEPRFTMSTELMGFDFNIGSMDYGPFWRKHRKLMHQSFHPTAAKKFRPNITKATRNALKRFLDDPDPRENHIPPPIVSYLKVFASTPLTWISSMAGETILSLTYGVDIQAKDDPYIKTSSEGAHSLMVASVPGTFLVDALPLLKYVPWWVPGASFQLKAREWRVLARRMLEMPFAAAQSIMNSGQDNASFVAENLRNSEAILKDDPELEVVTKNTAATLFVAGSDTTVSAITSCILGLLEYPDVLKKAQDELDRVVKPGHVPEFDDQDSLPYTTALAKEALRWRAVAPIAVPHFLATEDEYKGYRIPAGSIIVGNSHAMLHDERVYEDPFAFNPDRFIDPVTGKLDFSRARDPEHACWGFGRRICPGRHMAFSAVWLAIASLVYCFNFEKAKVKVVNDEGQEEERIVELLHDYIPALVQMPKPFECVVKPRSKEKENLIRSGVL